MRFDDHDRSSVLTRRECLRVGGLSAIGLSLPGLLQQRAAQAGNAIPKNAKAKSCIVLFMGGGPPQHETWDPKPDAPVEIRGDLGPISSTVNGFQVGELMPLTAKLTDKICALRAVSTKDNAHSTSGYAMSTGMAHQPIGVENANPGAPNDWPCMAAVVKHLRQQPGKLPASICLPQVMANDGNKTWPGQDAGWLGRSADPWLLTCDPSSDNFEIPGLALPAEVSASRFQDRVSLLQQIDRQLERMSRTDASDSLASWNEQAVGLLQASDARRAFDLSQESVETRDRYGRNKFGQSVLLARRLVEAGVGLVQVNWPRIPGEINSMWDTHQRNTEDLRKFLMPPMDQTYSALLEDLAQRGLLDETLVVWMGEFGRSPRINGAGGRDHWGSVFSIALAGGGVRGGQIYGASDRLGGEPFEGRVTAADVNATILHALGYPPQTMIHDRLLRPIPISQGTPLDVIF